MRSLKDIRHLIVFIIMLLLTSKLNTPLLSLVPLKNSSANTAVTVLRILSAWTLILASVGLGKTREKIN